VVAERNDGPDGTRAAGQFTSRSFLASPVRAGTGPVPSKAAIATGMGVYVVQKHDQATGRLTFGTVRRHLTNSSHHPRGIKVELDDGTIGRVQSLARK
jgi:uncharacterized repeat protein (TIGR03833 family)